MIPERVDVVGTPISLVSSDQLLALLTDRPADRATVVAFCNVHSVMTARGDTAVASALAGVDIATPDGMPIVWGLRSQGHPMQTRVDGPSFMRRAIEHGIAKKWRHYFYGSTQENLDSLVETVQRTFPGVDVVGSFSPPFRQPTDEDIRDAAERILHSCPDLVWVGLGMPKQELWMQRIRSQLPGVGLLGVGAAFDFLAGTTRRAPRWMQATGLEWLHRLASEPRRLWRRYLFNNPAYLALLARDLTRTRLRRQRSP
jgi:N-acetylglucosaminyldiphosphoundecaprenol N-acetyl-beta-D-mannosaminyltransferase